MFSKTNGFVVIGGSFQKARKQAEKALFLSAKLRTSFREQGATFSGKLKPQTPIPFLRGSHSHEKALLFQKTVFPTVIVPREKEAVRRLTTKKCGSPLRHSPCLGLSFAGTGFRSFLFPVFEDVLHRFIDCYT